MAIGDRIVRTGKWAARQGGSVRAYVLNQAEGAVDWLIGQFSPDRAFVRNHFKRMDRDEHYREQWFAVMRAGGFRAAEGGGAKNRWLARDSSADAEVSPALSTMRARSQELERNDPITKGLIGTFVDNVVGSQIGYEAQTGDPEKDARIEAVWSERKDHLYPAEGDKLGPAQQKEFSRSRVDGDVLVVRCKDRPSEPVWFAIVEAARLSTPTDVLSAEAGGTVQDGVDKDAVGRPVGYWVRKKHPGDGWQALIGKKSDYDYLLPGQVCHLKNAERPGQTRGVPFTHAIIQDLKDLDLLILASLKRMQVSACLSVFIKSPGRVGDIISATAKRYGYRMDQDLVPGMIFKLNPDEDVSTLVPNFPNSEYVPFILLLAKRIGAALGVSWQVVLKDWSESTYSSSRTDQLETRITYRKLQKWYVEAKCKWQWIEVITDAKLRGDERLSDVTVEDIEKVRCVVPGWAWVDPKNEAVAEEIRLKNGMTCLRDVIGGYGGDWEDVQDQWLVELFRMRRRAIEIARTFGFLDEDQVLAVLDATLERNNKPQRQPDETPEAQKKTINAGKQSG